MKKVLGIMMAVAMVAGLAAAEAVYSQNIVGFVKMEIPARGALQLRSVPLESGDQTLLDIFGTDQLTQAASYVNCDRIILWDTVAQKYQTWAQYTDGVFYKANNLTEWNAGIAGNPTVPMGTGFWINPGNAENSVVLSGDVVSVATQEVAIAEGFQILGIPFSSGVPIQDTAFFDSGAAANASYVLADRISVWDSESQSFQTYALYTDKVWYKANNLAEWNQGIVGDINLELGEGFFYQARGAITWSETNRYLSAFE